MDDVDDPLITERHKRKDISFWVCSLECSRKYCKVYRSNLRKNHAASYWHKRHKCHKLRKKNRNAGCNIWYMNALNSITIREHRMIKKKKNRGGGGAGGAECEVVC